MTFINEHFTNREIATSILFLVGLIWFMNKGVSFRILLKHLLAPRLLRVFLFFNIYIFLLIYSLNLLGFWKLQYWKITLIWVMFSAVISLHGVIKDHRDKNFFKKKLFDNFKLDVMLAFIISLQTFSLISTIILLILITFLAIINDSFKRNIDDIYAEKITTNLLAIIGWGLFIRTIWWLYDNASTQMGETIILEFFFPVIMTFCFIPFLYTLRAYVIYDNAFMRIGMWVPDVKLRRFTKLQTIIQFNKDVLLLDRWIGQLYGKDISSKDSILNSIYTFKRQIKEEDTPPFIHHSDGWSPHHVIKYFEPHGLKTNGYNDIGDNIWWASSTLEISAHPFPNSIGYYVEGNRKVAKSLILRLNINATGDHKAETELFIEAADFLCLKSLNQELPKDMKEAITSETNKRLDIENKTISIEILNLATEHSLRFTIKVSDNTTLEEKYS